MRSGSHFRKTVMAPMLLLLGVMLLGTQCPFGLSPLAEQELRNADVDKYVDQFTPVSSEDIGEGWTKHTFDPDSGNGPICIAGTPYSVYTKQGTSNHLLVMLQGGGACWQDFYFCNVLESDQAPPPPPVGIWADGFDTGTEYIPNPFAGSSVVYMPYCDGSVFTGDNDVVDPSFPFGPVRFHRGLRNLTAGIDVAKNEFPHPHRVTVAGSSAGGVGATAFAPFLTRFAYGNLTPLTVFNDAGPVTVNLNETAAIAARAADWQFGQFYPASCTDCDALGKATPIIDWRLRNDSTVREAFYSTDGDSTNRFFLNVPTQEMYRDLIVTEHGILNEDHPRRYKRFIRSGDTSHTALQNDLFYLGVINDVPLDEWSRDFVIHRHGWIDLVEDFIPAP